MEYSPLWFGENPINITPLGLLTHVDDDRGILRNGIFAILNDRDQ